MAELPTKVLGSMSIDENTDTYLYSPGSHMFWSLTRSHDLFIVSLLPKQTRVVICVACSLVYAQKIWCIKASGFYRCFRSRWGPVFTCPTCMCSSPISTVHSTLFDSQSTFRLIPLRCDTRGSPHPNFSPRHMYTWRHGIHRSSCWEPRHFTQYASRPTIRPTKQTCRQTPLLVGQAIHIIFVQHRLSGCILSKSANCALTPI